MAATEEQRSELTDRFLASDEADEWQGFVEGAKQALSDQPEAGHVLVPAAFLRAAMADIATAPMIFSHMKAAWNRAADELGLPEEKK